MANNEKVAKLQDRLAEALKIRKMKAKELSEKLNVNRGMVSYYLSGKCSPKADRMKLICEVLNVSEAWLLGYNVPMERNITEEIEETVSNIDARMQNQDALDFGISKAVDILLELKIPEETIKQMVLKHFDIRYSEITAILKEKRLNR